jgi:hypothetical protein
MTGEEAELVIASIYATSRHRAGSRARGSALNMAAWQEGEQAREASKGRFRFYNTGNLAKRTRIHQ